VKLAIYTHSCEWELQKGFSRSKVKVTDQTDCYKWRRASIHFDVVASRLTFKCKFSGDFLSLVITCTWPTGLARRVGVLLMASFVVVRRRLCLSSYVHCAVR